MGARSSIRVQLGARSPALLCGRPIESCGQGRRPVQRALLCTPHPSLRPGPTPWLCRAGGWHPPACGARSSLLSAHQEGLGVGAHSTGGAFSVSPYPSLELANNISQGAWRRHSSRMEHVHVARIWHGGREVHTHHQQLEEADLVNTGSGDCKSRSVSCAHAAKPTRKAPSQAAALHQSCSTADENPTMHAVL
jgi:hypothetical protein